MAERLSVLKALAKSSFSSTLLGEEAFRSHHWRTTCTAISVPPWAGNPNLARPEVAPRLLGARIAKAFGHQTPEHFADRYRSHTPLRLGRSHQGTAAKERMNFVRGLSTGQEVAEASKLLQHCSPMRGSESVDKVLSPEAGGPCRCAFGEAA